MSQKGSLVGHGFLVGRSELTNFVFDPNKPYVGCCICGTIYQGPLQDEWRIKHNKSHPDKEHLALKRSGLWCTPEAAAKLASYGVINFGDLLTSPEVADALRSAPRAPINDVEV